MVLKHMIIGVVCLGVVACTSDPKQTVIPARTQDLPQIQGQVKRLEDGERKLLTGYILRHTFSRGMDNIDQGQTYVPEGTTIGQAIEEQKQFVATQ